MSKVLVTESHLSDIADAIRAKNGTQTEYRPGDMAQAIADIPQGITPSGTIDIAYNGTFDVTNYASAAVAVPGGGVTVLTRDQWNALTTAQKQAYGLVAIQDASSGFKRGDLVYGADYGYLINSDPEKIKCIAAWENFDPNSLSWGTGDVPVAMASACAQYQSEEAVYFNAKTGFNSIGLELGSTSSDFTVYMVAKGLAYASGDVIVAGSVNAWGANALVMLYHRSGTVWRTSIFGSDTDLIDTRGGYVAIAIRSASMKASWFAYGATPRKDVSYSAHGTRFTFGGYGSNYFTDLAVKFVGYVAEAESDATVTANLANLAGMFNL